MIILFEAWRRTRGERSQWARTLGAASPASQEPSSRPALLPWLLCGLLVALLAGVGVYAWLIHAQAARQPPATTRVAARALSPIVEKAGRGPLPAKHQSGANDSRTTRNAAPPVKTVAKADAATPGLASHHDDVSTSVHDQARTRAKKQGPESTPSSVKTGSRPAKPVALAALPAGTREAFPEFTIVAHVWNPDKAMRFVVSGGRRIEPGEDIVAGVRLLDVTREGEIVRFRGYQVKLH
jgi:hypothetical protein